MIALKINGVPVLFIKAFTAADVELILQFVRDAASFHKGNSNRVLFIDTPITAATVEAIVRLQEEGFTIVLRDHHGVDGHPANDRERQVATATVKLRRLLGKNCNITVRRLHPACSTLVSVGEFADAVAIIADPDADGLTSAMKAAGVAYPEMDDDAAKLDGEPKLQLTGTEISQLLVKGITVIPSYDASKPRQRETELKNLFSDWVHAVKGNDAAMQRLREREAAYQNAVCIARKLASESKKLMPGVIMVDATLDPLFDPLTLSELLEANAETRITIIRKNVGPIAAIHGIQYTLSVSKPYQQEVNLHHLVPNHMRSDPEQGVICNVRFILHASEEVWLNHVYPKLKHLMEEA